MKYRMIALCMLCLMLSGCGLFRENIMEPVSFYFLQKNYSFEDRGRMIVPEERDASGHRDDLSYMLALYLMGPIDDAYTAPLPRGTRIYVKDHQNGSITLQLSEAAHAMTDAEFSLACGCLTLTCLDIADAEKVTIINGERVISMTKDTLTLYDSPSQIQSTEETS